MNNKGVIYIFLGVIFVGVFAALFITFNEYTHEDDFEAVETRVNTMNDFVKDLHQDLERAAFITGFRALIGVEEYLSSKEEFFDNQSAMEEHFRDVFLDGEINGSTLDIMVNASFNDYLERVSAQAEKIGIDVDINITSVGLSQRDPWSVYVRFTGAFDVADKRKVAWWDYRKEFYAEVPIEGLKDPLYTVATTGDVPNTIERYDPPPTGYVNDTDNSTDILKEFLEGSYYRASTTAPSFLQRFTNNLSSSPYGIESLVYLPALSDQGVTPLRDRSVVDYLYFSQNPDNSTDRCNVQNMLYLPEDWFRIDADHLDDYGLDGLSSDPC